MLLAQCSNRTKQITGLKEIWIISMQNNIKLYVCRVCGAIQSNSPWGITGNDASFNICDCCGVEFGYEDSTLAGLKRYREKWLSEGAKWNTPKLKPSGWLLDEQLNNIPSEYR